MELRTGNVKMTDIVGQEKKVFVAKFQLSDKNFLAQFQGGGLTLSEDFVKHENQFVEKITFDQNDKMPDLNVIVNGQGAWTDLQSKREKVLHLSDPNISIARVPHGMKSGRSSIMIRIDLPNGTVIMAENSMRCFLACADIFRAAEEESHD